ncbi:MAG: xylulokinase, partial [Pseudomonadota bacterium]
MTYLGIDIGTSGVKALLMDAEQTIISVGMAPLTVSRPHAGWCEQDPTDWIGGVRMALEKVRRDAPKAYSAVAGLGLSGHMHGATLLDKNGRVLRPCILWNDTRSHAEAQILDNNPAFRAITGNIAFPGFTAPKLAWVKDHEPSIFASVHKVLLPKDYVRLWLTGEYVSEMSDASGTSWLNVAKRDWSNELLNACDLGREHMPNLIEGTDVSGVILRERASHLGLPTHVKVAGGAGDNAASAIGMGAINNGDAFLSLGTSGVLFAVNDVYSPNADSAVHAFCHAQPESWHQMGVTLSAADSLNWLATITGKTPAQLTQALPGQLSGPSDITFLPYLSGERTPHNDAKVRGVFAGLNHTSDTTALTRAVIEGVSFAFKDCLNALGAAGTRIHRATVVGGGSKSRYWLQTLATVLNIQLDVPQTGD